MIDQKTLAGVRIFIEKKSFDFHRNDTEYCNHRDIMKGIIPSTTGLCVHGNTCLIKVMDNENAKLQGGYCLNPSMKVDENIKKSYLKNLASQDRFTLHGWIHDPKTNEMFGLHWWIQLDDKIIDITADQFHLDKIIVTSIDDPRYIASSDNDEFDIKESQEMGNEWADQYLLRFRELHSNKDVEQNLSY